MHRSAPLRLKPPERRLGALCAASHSRQAARGRTSASSCTAKYASKRARVGDAVKARRKPEIFCVAISGTCLRFVGVERCGSPCARVPRDDVSSNVSRSGASAGERARVVEKLFRSHPTIRQNGAIARGAVLKDRALPARFSSDEFRKRAGQSVERAASDFSVGMRARAGNTARRKAASDSFDNVPSVQAR